MRLAISLIALAAANALLAQPPPGNALTILNQYLAQAAADTPSYRADIRAGGNTQGTAQGRLLAFSSILGSFTYRPMRYGELSPADRAALLSSPAFRAFLVSRRPAATDPAVLQLFLSPEDVLRLGPIFAKIIP